MNLEAEFMKMRSNANTLTELCEKYPALKNIDSFTTGMIATMMDVINRFNAKVEKQSIAVDEESQVKLIESSRKMVVEQAKKV